MLPRYLFTLSLLLLSVLGAGQTCGLTDTVRVDDPGLSTVTLPITGYLNDDLGAAGQGLCGITLYFEHSYVYDLTVELTSPGGQSVRLIGPDNDQSRPPTTRTRWFIDFLRCDSTAAPAPGAPARWDNNDPYNWPAFSVRQGDYFPNAGCLEDLNSGPVNGDWTLTFNNFRSNEQARLTYVLLTFCDSLNADGPCCFADAGRLTADPPVEGCVDDPPAVAPAPRYARPRPDSAEYAYTYLISRAGRVVGTDPGGNLDGYPAGDYEVCGLSYRRGELPNLVTDGSLSLDDLRADLDGVTPALCGQLTDDCQAVTLFARPDTTEISAVICDFDTYSVGTNVYDATGLYTPTLVGRGGCDSVVRLDLQVVSELRWTEDTTICFGAAYPQGSNVYTTPGTYVDTLLSTAGCDSIVTLNLRVAENIVTDTAAVICAGDAFLVGTEAFSESTTVTRIVTAANGCDSTVNLDLLVLDPTIVAAPTPTELTCDNDPILLDVTASRFTFTATFEWRDTLGNVLGNGLTLPVTAAGTYVFELSEATRGLRCTVRDTFRITDARFALGLELARSQVQGSQNGTELSLDCRSPDLGIEATVDTVPPGLVYEWSTVDGQIRSGSTTPTIVVGAGGTYGLRVEDPATGCFAEETVTVAVDSLIPRAAIAGVGLLNCATPRLELAADTLQDRRAELDFRWSGDCLSGTAAGPLLDLDCAGSVTLLVENRTNGCQSVSTVVVEEDLAAPFADLAPASAPLSCYFPERLLAPTAAGSANGVEYVWQLAGSPDTLSRDSAFLTRRAGDFLLTVADRRSRCQQTLPVSVPADTLRPVADSGADTLTLNCYTPTHLLGGNSSSGPAFRYAWVQRSNPDDTLGTDRQFPVEAPGGYFRLAVLNEDNGCRSFDSTRVLLELDTPFVRLDLPLDFDCFVDSLQLSADRTSRNFPNTQRWTGPCVLSETDSSQVWVGCTGRYTYEILNERTGCRAEDSVRVELADNSVQAVLISPVSLDCETGEAFLDRRLGTNAPIVEWYRDGEPIRLVGQQPRVTVPGVYTLVLGNFNGSCRDTATAVVVADCPALAVIVPHEDLNCRNNTVVTLEAGPSIPAAGANVVVEWLTPPGASFIAGETERQLIVFTPGRYGFVVRNLISGAADTSFTEVGIDIQPPVAEAGPSDTITCDNPLALLDGSQSDTLGEFSFVWSSSTIDTVSEDIRNRVGEPGIYFLRVTNEVSGCSATDNVTVFRNVAVPDLSYTSTEIPCDTTDFPLTVVASEPGRYRYQWAGNDIVAQADSATVRIAEPGRYGVTVTNLDNGCPATGGVLATRAPCPPFPSLADTTLTCTNDTLRLAARFREPCVGCSYRWRFNGMRLDGETDSILLVTEPGDYRLDVTNGFSLSNSVTTFVSDSRVLPRGNAGPDRLLSCDSLSVALGRPTEITDFEFRYRWLAEEGTLPGATAPTTRVDRGGLYRLETTNVFSGCVGLDTVLVGYDTLAPVANAGPQRVLTCDQPRRVLDGLGSSLGNRYRYRWSGGGSDLCLEGATTPSPIARCDGTYTLEVLDTTNGCRSTATVTVVGDDELPLLVPLADTLVNCYSDSLLLDGRPPGGDDQVYVWERTSSDPPTVLRDAGQGTTYVSEAGEYRFTVTDTLTGCSNQFELTVATDFGQPFAEAGPSDTFYCALDSLVLTGLAGGAGGRPVDYQWTSPIGFQIGEATTLSAVIYQPDSYVLTATDPINGCSASDTVHILRDVEAPLVDAGRDTTLNCQRRTVRLSGDALTLSGQREFRWSTQTGLLLNGENGQTPLVGAAGSYLLEVRDPVNDCSSGDIVRVTEDTLRPTARIAEPDGLLLDCNQPELLLDGRLSSGRSADLAYQWAAPPGAPTPGSLTRDQLLITFPGPYQLTVTDLVNGCRDTTRVEATADFAVPTVSIAPPASLTCRVDTVALQVPIADQDIRYAYRWLDPQGEEIGTGPEIRVGATGSYRVATRDVINGCRDTTVVNVRANRTPPTVVLAEPAPLNCFRTVSTIDGTGSSQGDRFRVRWNSPGSTGVATASPLQLRGSVPGNYVLTLTDTDNGCVATDTVRLEQRAIAVDGLEINVEQPDCELDRTGAVEIVDVVGGTPPYRYRLDGGLLTDRLRYDGLPLGRHTVAVVDADGCTQETDFNLLPGQPIDLLLRSDTTIRLGDSLPLTFTTTAPRWDTLLWSSEGPLPVVRPGEGPLTVRPLRSQRYRLTLVSESGCTVSDDVVIDVDATISLYLPTAFSPNGDGNNDVFRVYPGAQVESVLALRIFDRWGELVYDLDDDPLAGTADYGWRGELDGRPLNPAVFIYRLLIRTIDGDELWYTGDVTLVR